MWQTKVWKLADKAKYEAWIARNQHRYQIVVIFVNNGWGVEYRPLRKIG